ncbi:MAG TPA: hypothetical protein VMN36_03420 [Verrucomicrobiales bacterium]|nr:hypothetical protein [Verrucomicrobiales bacterium]
MRFSRLCGFGVRAIALGIGGGLISAANAQLPVARLDTVFPAGVQAGAEVDVALSGENLDELSALVFSHGGLSGELSGEGRFLVRAAPGTPAGLYEIRVLGRFGVSNPRAFAVSAFAEALEPENNDTAERAFPLGLNQIVHGRADTARQDWFRLSLRSGQRVLLLCEAERLESPMDATVLVSDGEGRELARSRDETGRDARLTFSAPRDGDYFVRVYDFLYRGDGRYVYRLLATDQPRVESLFPPFAVPGAEQVFRARGFALVGAEDEMDIVGTAGAEEEKWLVGPGRFLHEAGIPGLWLKNDAWKGNAGEGVWLGVSASAPVFENEHTDQDGQNSSEWAQEVEAPCEIAGTFETEGDVDWYRFLASAGQALVLDLQHHRLGHPGDPVMTVEKLSEEGNISQVGRVDDDGVQTGKPKFLFGSRDPTFRLEPDADAVYRIRVADQFRLGDPGRGYRLSIRTPNPGFTLVTVCPRHADQNNQANPWSAFLRRNGTADLLVYLLRRDGFDGAVDLRVDDLPQGVSASPGRIEAGQDSGRLVLRAAGDAPAWTGPVRVWGRAAGETGAEDVESIAAGLLWPVGDFNNERMEARLARQIFLAVSGVEEDPLELVPATAEGGLEVSVGGSVEIPFRLTKRGELKGDWKLGIEGIPGLGAPPEVKIDLDQEEAKVVLDLQETDKNKVGPGEYVMLARASGAVSYRANPQAVERAEEEKKRREQNVQGSEAALQEAARARDEMALNLENLRAAAQAGDQQAVPQAADVETALSSAERRLQEIQQQLDSEKRRLEEAQQRAAAATERANPKDLQHAVYAPAIRIKVFTPPDEKQTSLSP